MVLLPSLQTWFFASRSFVTISVNDRSAREKSTRRAIGDDFFQCRIRFAGKYWIRRWLMRMTTFLTARSTIHSRSKANSADNASTLLNRAIAHCATIRSLKFSCGQICYRLIEPTKKTTTTMSLTQNKTNSIEQLTIMWLNNSTIYKPITGNSDRLGAVVHHWLPTWPGLFDHCYCFTWVAQLVPPLTVMACLFQPWECKPSAPRSFTQ